MPPSATAFFLVAGVTESMLVFEHSFDVRHAVHKEQRYSGNTAEVVEEEHDTKRNIMTILMSGNSQVEEHDCGIPKAGQCRFSMPEFSDIGMTVG